MKYISICIIVILASVKAYSQGSTCPDATPFCISVGTPFTYPNSTVGDYGSVGCLQSSPGPNWFFIKTTTPGTYIFEIDQSSTPGGSPDLDVDFIAWGPYSSPQCTFASGGGGLDAQCNSLGAPWGSVEDCSYCWDPTEIMTLSPTSNCQVFMILITNYEQSSGYITFTQISGPATDCNITSANWTAPTLVCVTDTPFDLNTLLNGGTPGGTWSGPGVSGTIFDPAAAGPGAQTITYAVSSGLCPMSVTHDIDVSSVITPSFTQLGPYCLGETPDILSRVSLNNVMGSWNPSSISTSTIGTSVYTFTPQSGECAMTATMSITVTASMTPVFDQLGPYCVGGVADGLPGVSLNGVAGSWNPPVISTASIGTTVYTFTPSSSFCATQASMSITVGNPVVPDFPSIPPFCAGETPPVLPLTSPNGISGIWSPAVIDNMNSGTYYFTPGINVCATPFTLNVTVNPTPSVTALCDTDTICEGYSSQLSAYGASSYSWSNGLGGASVVNASPLSTTTYTVTGTENGCSDTGRVTITVIPKLHPTITGQNPSCGMRNGNATVNVPTGLYSFEWNTTPVQYTQTAAFLGPGTYTVTVTYNGCPETASVMIVYDNIPVASFISVPEKIVIGMGDINFSDRSFGNISQSIWYFGDSTEGNGLNVSHTYIDTGKYLVTHIVIDEGGCTDTTYGYVYIISDFNFYIPNSFTPNGDNVNEIFLPKANGVDPDSYYMAIYTRWGGKIFETRNLEEGWNGHYNNKGEWRKAVEGVYVYSIELRDLNNIIHRYTGAVTLAK